MKLTLVLPVPPQNCVELEQALGLSRDNVLRLVMRDEEIEVEFSDSVVLPNPALEERLGKVFGMVRKKSA